jgi:hypothetical protein
LREIQPGQTPSITRSPRRRRRTSMRMISRTRRSSLPVCQRLPSRSVALPRHQAATQRQRLILYCRQEGSRRTSRKGQGWQGTSQHGISGHQEVWQEISDSRKSGDWSDGRTKTPAGNDELNKIPPMGMESYIHIHEEAFRTSERYNGKRSPQVIVKRRD